MNNVPDQNDNFEPMYREDKNSLTHKNSLNYQDKKGIPMSFGGGTLDQVLE